MTHDEYNEKIKHLRDRLEQISKRTEQMGLAGSGNADNPELNKLMAEFDVLVKKSDKIITEMLKTVGLM